MKKSSYIFALPIIFFAQSITSHMGIKVISQPVVLPSYNLRDVNRVNISQDGNLLIRGNLGGNFRLYSLLGPSGSVIADYSRDEDAGEYFVMPFFSSRSRYTLLNSALQANDFDDRGRIRVINTTSGKFSLIMDTQLRGFVGTNFTGMSWPNIFDFSPDETLLAYTKDGKNLTIYDLQAEKEKAVIALNEPYYCTAIAFHPSGNYVATKSGDKGTITLWDIKSQKQIAVFTDPDGYDMSDSMWYDEKTVRFSNDGAYLATFSTLNSMFYLWDVSQRRLIKRDFGSYPQIRTSLTNNYMAIGNTIFNQNTEAFYTLNIGGSYGYLAVSFSPDGKLIALSSNEIYVFETVNFTQLGQAPRPDQSYVSALAFRDNTSLYALSASGAVSYVEIDY